MRVLQVFFVASPCAVAKAAATQPWLMRYLMQYRSNAMPARLLSSSFCRTPCWSVYGAPAVLLRSSARAQAASRQARSPVVTIVGATIVLSLLVLLALLVLLVLLVLLPTTYYLRRMTTTNNSAAAAITALTCTLVVIELAEQQ